MKIFSSVKTRLTLWFVLIIALIIIIFSLALYTSLEKSLKKSIDSSLEAVAKERHYDILEDMEIRGIKKRIGIEDIEDIENIEEEKALLTTVYAQMIELSIEPWQIRKIIAKSKNLKDAFLPLPHYPGNRMNIKMTHKSFSLNGISDFPLRLITYPFKVDNNTYYILQYATPLKGIKKTLNNLLMIILVIDPVVLILSFFCGYFLVNKTLAPVKTVVSSAKRITAADLSHRIKSIGSRDEIAELIDTFNHMISRLEHSFKQIKQFSSDVSHELKSPLTVIRGEIDVALRKKRYKKEYILTLENVLEEVKGLQQIIGNLLFLSGTEFRNTPIPFEMISVDKIILEVFEDVHQMAMEKNIRFILKDIPGIDIEGEETLLKRVFSNLLENTIKYSNPGGEVEILLEKKSGFAKISIKDKGIGIAEENLPYIFDTFFRVDNACSRKTGSIGLGLSIVKRSVDLHKGRIEVASTTGEGSTFMVFLPIKH